LGIYIIIDHLREVAPIAEGIVEGGEVSAGEASAKKDNSEKQLTKAVSQKAAFPSSSLSGDPSKKMPKSSLYKKLFILGNKHHDMVNNALEESSENEGTQGKEAFKRIYTV
jgi:hypothetical protein